MSADSRFRAAITKSLMDRYFPDRNTRPEGLLFDIYRALSEAELRGYADCLSHFEKVYPGNDNASPTLKD